MSGMRYDVLRDGVEHAIGNMQSEFNASYGIEEVTQINTDLLTEMEKAFDTIANCLWKQLELERNPISVHYCEKDDMTFIMQDSYDENGNLYKQQCVGWYYGAPDPELTKTYTCDLVAEYTSADHRLRGADR
jgi:hypothetical protein